MTKNEALQEVQALSKGITHDAAQLLELLGTGAVQLPIDDTDKYVVIGTLAMIAKALPAEQNANALGEFAGYDLDTGEPLVTWYDRSRMPLVGDRLCVCPALPLAAPAPQSDEPVAELDEFTKRSIREYGDFREDVERLSTADSRTRKALRKEIYDTIDARVRNAVEAALATQAATAAPVRADVPAELTDEAIDGLWSAMPGGPDGWLKKFGYRQFARSIARHVLVRVAASMAGAIRPTDDELWEQTIGERDCYHEWADKLANAIAAHLGAEIGEHSNMNCPWAEALEVIESASPALRPSEQAVRDQALEEGLEMAARHLDKQRQAVDQDHAYQEPDTGAWVFDRPETEEYSNTLAELADEIRALKSPSTAQPSNEKGGA